MKNPQAPAGVLCLLAALTWAGAIQSESRYPVQSMILSAGLLILACSALVGMVVRGSGWARRLAGGLAVGELGLAMLTPVSPWWWAGVGLAGGTLALVGGPWLRASENGRAARIGPPPRAVLLLCLLACLPVGMAAASINGLGGGWVLVGLSAVTAPAYAKTVPGALFAARFLIPAASVAAAFTTPWPGWTVAAVGGGAATWAAWSEDARLAVRPLVETGPPPAPEPTPLRIRSAAAGPRRPRDAAGQNPG